jgi:hypothetical protein
LKITRRRRKVKNFLLLDGRDFRQFSGKEKRTKKFIWTKVFEKTEE